jgi:hypothetical protein
MYMSAGITDTPYTISFCLSVTPNTSPPPVSFTDGSVNAGSSTTLHSAAGAGFVSGDVGRTVIDTAGNIPEATTISSVISSTQVTVNNSMTPFAAGTDTVTITPIVEAAATPTYNAGGTSDAFLGDTGFYIGIPGDAALYTSVQGAKATVSLTNISLTDGNNNPASNWELVTGDAETTDKGEEIQWTSNVDLNLLPDDGVGATQQGNIGDSCNYAGVTSGPSNNWPNTWLTGVGTTTVDCQASATTPKDGTVMLQAQAPKSLSIYLNGTGLQAAFVGVLLP